MKKTVSVVIPTIGTGERLEALDHMLDSILRQTVPFDEIIVFDNSGLQNVRARSKHGEHPGIKWFSSPKMLPMHESFSTAASFCTCDYMTIQGDDDELYPNFCSEVHKKTEKGAEVILAPYEFMDENENDLQRVSFFPLKDVPIKAFMDSNICLVIGSLIFSKEIYEKTAGFQKFCFKGLYMDWLLFWEMGMHCGNISVIPSYVFRYRVSSQWSGTLRTLDDFIRYCVSLDEVEKYGRRMFLANGYQEKDCSFLGLLGDYDTRLRYDFLQKSGLSFKDFLFLCFKKMPPRAKFGFRDRLYCLRRAFFDQFRNEAAKR